MSLVAILVVTTHVFGFVTIQFFAFSSSRWFGGTCHLWAPFSPSLAMDVISDRQLMEFCDTSSSRVLSVQIFKTVAASPALGLFFSLGLRPKGLI